MGYTFPNQRTIKINREAAKRDFLGIKNENWQFAARDLGAHALMLYMYFASNANGFELALSPAAIENAIGMPRSTYHDQFRKLLNKGYLVETSSNHYSFFEVSQPRITSCESCLTGGDNKTSADRYITFDGQDCPRANTEINNSTDIKNKQDKNINQFAPKVEVITIPTPKREGKYSDIKAKEKEFVF